MEALKNLIYQWADDQMLVGHRNSEWTGIGPVLEEDIAYASMAQDKIGHALALYNLMHTEMGEQDPDTIAFSRTAGEWKNSVINELMTDDYGFSLVRHFLFDYLELIRFEGLKSSSNEGLANLARRFHSEIKYHVMHGDIWMKQLANGTEESKARIQDALNKSFEYLGQWFTAVEGEQTLIDQGIFEGVAYLQSKWEVLIGEKLAEYGLTMPSIGNKGTDGHTADLQQLLDEMTEVYQLDPSSEW